MARYGRKREFPVQVPEYIQEHYAIQLGVEQPPKVFVMRSEYERRQALRLIDEGVLFEYESAQLEYLAKVHNGICLDCGSEDTGSCRSYTPDFFFPNTRIFVETKGKFDSQNRTKMKEIAEQSSDDIRMVFMRDNWLTKKRKMSYSRWCELNNIQFAIGDIPLEWT